MGGSESKPAGAGSARSANKPARIEDFIARRNEQLRSLGLRIEDIASIIKDDTDLLQNVTTLHNINTLISRFYADNMIPEDRATEPIGVLQGFGVDGLYRMNASKNNCDCLAHSFLTATCENFRRLEQNSKDEFANFFRRTIFLTLPAVQCFMENERDEGRTMARRVMSSGFLYEQELRLLAAQFRVNILAATGESGRFQPTDVEALRITLPVACVPGGAFQDTIGIYTNGTHFEALRDAEGYIFSERKMAEFIHISETAVNLRQGAGNNNMARAIAASLVVAKKPALNRRAIANSLGIPAAELNAYTNANLEKLIGGGKRKTRRRRA